MQMPSAEQTQANKTSEVLPVLNAVSGTQLAELMLQRTAQQASTLAVLGWNTDLEELGPSKGKDHSYAEQRRPKSAYHKYDVMVCFFSDIAILVPPISPLIHPVPALHISRNLHKHLSSAKTKQTT